MTAHLLIFAFTVIVVAIVWYAVSNRDHDLGKKQKVRRVAGQDRKPGNGPLSVGLPVHENAGKAVDSIPFPPLFPQMAWMKARMIHRHV